MSNEPADLKPRGRRGIPVATAQFLAIALGTLAGCGFPHDPDATCERVAGGTLRAGITENPPWTELTGNKPAGHEVDLLERFAERIKARIEWVPGAESRLFEALGRRELDVVIGGITADTPWASHIGMTQPYTRRDGRDHVMAVPSGENRWLLELDRFLQDQATVAARGEAP
jgi:ABC-type amino acid transport substrate-binding protein